MEDCRAASEYDEEFWNLGEVSLPLSVWINLGIGVDYEN